LLFRISANNFRVGKLRRVQQSIVFRTPSSIKNSAHDSCKNCKCKSELIVSPIRGCTRPFESQMSARKARSKRLLKGKLLLQQASAESCKSKKFPAPTNQHRRERKIQSANFSLKLDAGKWKQTSYAAAASSPRRDSNFLSTIAGHNML
jgi:hypothetical protein